VSGFEDYALQSVARALNSVAPDDARDVYAVSLWVNDEEDDARRTTFVVGFNTEARVREVTPQAWDEEEARWNFAHWLQNELVVVAGGYEGSEDAEGLALRRRWIEELGLWYADDGESDESYRKGGEIYDQFFALAVRLVKRLHDSGVVERAFGRPLPVVIHELEYCDEITEYNRAANAPELIEDFLRWVEHS
jgi:hypothetical protein